LAPHENGYNGPYQSVGITVYQGSNPPSLETLTNLILDKQKNISQNFELLEKLNTKIDGKDAMCIVYSMVLPQGFAKQKQYNFYNNSTLYTLTYTANVEAYDQYLSQAESIIKSIETTE